MPILIGSGGISNYVSPLIQHFTCVPESTVATTLHFRTASSDRKKKLADFIKRRLHYYKKADYKQTNFPDRFLGRLWLTHCNLVNSLTLPKTDVYLATTEMIPLHSGIRRVTIFHDLTPALIPAFFAEPKEKYLGRMRFHLQNCDHIVTVSDTTAQDVVRLCGVKREKISVILPGRPLPPEDDAFDPETLPKLGITKPFMLYVGGLSPNKNTEGTIRCFSRFIKKTGRDWQLVMAGKNHKPHGYYENLARSEKVSDRVVLTGWLGDERWLLFRHARLLLHLSWYEGFGIPLLEAMVSGLPILASDRGSLREVLQKEEQLVDPQDEARVVDKLCEYAESPRMEERWKRWGDRRAEDFSWEKSANLLFETMKKVMQDREAASL